MSRILHELSVLTAVAGVAGCVQQQPIAPRHQSARWDVSAWRQVLDSVVTSDGLVRYPQLLPDSPARLALAAYVRQIGRISPDIRPDLFPNETDKLAFWLNTYNALALEGVLRNGPPRTINPSRLLNDMVFTVGAQRMALDTLEQQRLRVFGEPRVFFAICTMTRSSPPLRREPYRGDELDEQLADQARRYLSDPRIVQRIDSSTVGLSEWLTEFYARDFREALARSGGRRNPRLLDVLAALAPEDSPLRQASKFRTIHFDWSLNATPE